jgi:hypothetical protein
MSADLQVAWIAAAAALAAAFMAAAAALAGAVVGGLASYLGSWWATGRQVRWERQQLMRERLEAIGDCANQVAQGTGSFTARVLESFEIGQAPDLEEGVERIAPFDRLRTLVTFYAPELHEELRMILHARVQYVVIAIFSAYHYHEAPEDRRRYLRECLTSTAAEIGEACTALIGRAAALIHEQLDLPVSPEVMQALERIDADAPWPGRQREGGQGE